MLNGIRSLGKILFPIDARYVHVRLVYPNGFYYLLFFPNPTFPHYFTFLSFINSHYFWKKPPTLSPIYPSILYKSHFYIYLLISFQLSHNFVFLWWICIVAADIHSNVFILNRLFLLVSW